MKDQTFQANLRCRWKQLRQTNLSLARINFLIDSVYNLTAEARQRHFQKWPTLGKYVWPNPEPIAQSYNGEIDYLKKWIENRLLWIDNNIPNDGTCYDYPVNEKVSISIDGFPNPVIETFNLIIKSKVNQQLEVQAVDVMGRRVFAKSLSVNAGYNNYNVDMRAWSGGVYFFKYVAETGEQKTQKILKQ
jgi:hypothetical protein